MTAITTAPATIADPAVAAADPAAPQNLFGICARVGEDFGFNPLWLRLGFAAALILNPVVVIASYFALGGVVLSSRLVFPNRQMPVAPAPERPSVPALAVIAVEDEARVAAMPIAA